MQTARSGNVIGTRAAGEQAVEPYSSLSAASSHDLSCRAHAMESARSKQTSAPAASRSRDISAVPPAMQQRNDINPSKVIDLNHMEIRR